MSFQTHGWQSDLAPVLKRIASIGIGDGELRILSLNSRMALGLPADREAAKLVSELYHPHRWKGRMLKSITHVLIATYTHKLLPSFKGLSGCEPEIDWLSQAAKAGTVGFLGCNPSHGLRCILSGTLPETGKAFIAKLGFDQGATAIQREADFLKSIEGKYPGVIGVMDFQNGSDWNLLRLNYLGEEGIPSMADSRVRNLLESWISEEKVSLGELPWSRRLLDLVSHNSAPAGWHEKMENLTIHRALVHGDFAVWNLRLVNGTIQAFDWEWGNENGVAGIDLAHGLRQEYSLVKAFPAKHAIAAILNSAQQPPWQSYLEKTGWKDHQEDWLRLGLLHSHFNTNNDSQKLLAELGILVER